METGISNTRAPELRVETWLDAEGAPRPPLRLSELGPGYKILYCFQHCCPGCHSTGFPTLRRLVDALPESDFGFAVVQTVFEDSDVNTVDKLSETQCRYGLNLPFGHDTPAQDAQHPTIMQDYRTGGTPWFIVISPQGFVVHSDFRLNADRFIDLLRQGEKA